MSEKHLKEIAKELKLIRRELQKFNTPRVINADNISKEELETMINELSKASPLILSEE